MKQQRLIAVYTNRWLDSATSQRCLSIALIGGLIISVGFYFELFHIAFDALYVIPTNWQHLPVDNGTIFNWITTREGLTSRFMQMERIHSQVRAQNRTLRIIDNQSIHYKDLPKICMCDIFVLPSTIICSSVSPNVVVHKFNCVLDKLVPEQNHKVEGYRVRKQYSWLVKPSKKVIWNIGGTACGLLYGLNFPFVHNSDALEIIFQLKYTQMFERVRDNLGYAFRQGDYVVAHWRRGDQIQKCRMREEDEKAGLGRDTSVNCGSAQDLIESINMALNRSTTPSSLVSSKFNRGLTTQVFVATNEHSAAILADLSRAGFKLLRDGVPARERAAMTSLDAFVVEMQLMIDAKRFLGWGSTGIGPFIKRARLARGHSEG